ncbi:DUF2786 domain-containing protein [Lentzea sp. NBRC 105346]|uniref:DUF2786 domain-containing protein n=1 Tax=Lentzea sp. NBRC 105346 TaxID=3032205 RepID=UPI0025577651|nr:DUF2786 domain-containing protein [Lentzea sp. NBRC 105346]
MDENLLGEAVEALWRGGWLPYDVHQVVSRNLTESEVSLVVDAITASCARHHPSTMHPRWLQQLTEIGAEVWWDRSRPLLPQWAVRHIETPEYTARTLARLLKFLGSLGVLPRILPLPGTATGSAVPLGVDQKVLNRVRGLLAKAESTQFPEEAEALSAKAQELMNRHALERAMLDAGAPQVATSRRMWLEKSYFKAKAQLVGAVADAHRSRAVVYGNVGFVALVGEDLDLEITELLSTSLLVQATRAMVQAGAGGGEARSRGFRQSFLISYAHRIGERLTAAPVSDERLLPVLVERKQAVDELYDQMFTRTKTMRVSVGSAAGWHAGRTAADLADIEVGRSSVTSG